MARAIISVPLLTLVYALTLNSFALWDLLIGGLISALLLVLTRKQVFEEMRSPSPGVFQRIVAFLPFAAAVIADVVQGTWEVALVSLKLRPLPQAGIVAVPIGERSPVGIAVTSLITTLSPGSVLIEVDDERRVMLFHVFDVQDPDHIRAQYQTFYDRYQRHVFP
ncbi:MAG: Na+/H+ antiporter subunit E [Oscillochloris sp.]|nr:Na+/H+ antiporter subunit E [Oscillochloris sp.]